MSEVNATGMLNCIPECAVRVYNALRTLLWERATYWRGQTLHSFTNKVFSGPQKRTSGCGSPRFLLCNQNFYIKKSPYRVSKGTIVIFMKKYVLMLMSLFMMVCSANAQIKDDIQKSKERAAKLQALCNDYKTSGSANVDGYGDAVKNAAVLAIANSVQLENMYKREIGETQDGVTDVTITKPTLDEWVTFAATVAGEAASIKAATDKVQAAADEAKKMIEEASKQKNPMKAAKAAKTAKAATAVVEFGNTATLILVEESAAQVKAVNTIIETLKSGKNL